MSVAIVESHDCDIQDLVARVTLVDGVKDVEGHLRKWIRSSDQVWLGMHDDRVACLWGLCPLSAISNRAYLWLLTTDIVDQHKFIFIRHSQIVIDDALEQYSEIYGHVAIHNDRAKKWLRWLGAKFSEPSEGFIPFRIGRKQ